ncbi:ROK family transcriptional regulator, partial [Actinotalea ferrariae CF5-4]
MGTRAEDAPTAVRAGADGPETVHDGADGPTGAVVGLDVGGSKIDGVLVVGGEVVGRRRSAVRHGADGVVGSAAEAVEELLADARRAGAPVRLRAVGAGVPGIVAPGRGTVEHAVNLGVVGAAPVGPDLAERLGVPVVVENDLNVAALGAARTLGLGDDLAYLSLGTGLAAGLLLDGRLRRGSVGAAGEIGHVPYRPDGRSCPCGQRGCLEQYASGSAIDGAWAADGVPGPARLFAAAA